MPLAVLRPARARPRALLAALAAALALGIAPSAAQASCSGSSCPPAPVNTAAPSVTTPDDGAILAGDALAAAKGTWTSVAGAGGSDPTTYSYAWSRCDSAGNACAAISGATATTYTVVAADVGHRLRVAVTATNARRVNCGRLCVPYEVTNATTATSGPSVVVADADHVGPKVTLSGTAYDARASGLTGDNYPLHVAATDAVANGHRAGVKRIQIQVDGVVRSDSGDVACPAGNCPLATDFTVRTSDLADGADGTHAIQVIVTDAAGNATPVPFAMFFNYGGRPDPYASEANDPLAPDELNGSTYAGDPCAVDLPECHEDDPDDDADYAARGQSLAAAATSTAPLYGLADQDGNRGSYPFSTVLGSGEFLNLRVRRLRITVPWDMMLLGRTDPTNADSLARFEDWYNAIQSYNMAHSLDILPLVSFDRHRGSSIGAAIPDYTRYRTSVRAFFLAYPNVHEFSAFNEANDPGHQLSTQPELAALMYKALHDECSTNCTHILGGEFVDNASYSQSYLTAYINKLRADSVPLPRIWAWHAYKSFSDSGLAKFRGFLQRIGHRDVWLTEQGGIERKSGQVVHDEAGANQNLQKILDLPTRASTSAIKRFYIYQFSGEKQYDAGLVTRPDEQQPNGPLFTARPLLYPTFKAKSNPSNQAPLG